MTILKFDTEGITSCPMNEIATKEECLKCGYIKGLINFEEGNMKIVNCYVEGGLICIYKDVFPEEEEIETVDSIMPYPEHYSPGQPAPFCKPGE